MAVTASKSLGLVNLLASDNVLIQALVGIDRQVIGSFVVHNTTVGVLQLDLYVSPDLTSASGDIIYSSATIPANSQTNISELIGQSFPSGLNLIAVPSAIGINSLITVNQYA